MWNSCITTLAVWDYIGKEMVFVFIFNPKTSISKIIDLVRPVDEWSEIAFPARQNTEIEHCDTLKNLVHKLNFHH